jgi:hypothetical protein
MKYTCFLFLLSLTAGPLDRVRAFLQLSDGQAETIYRNNDEYNSFSLEKQARIARVQTEIYNESGRDSLDPMALGVRYVEIELICRDLTDKAKRLREQNLAALTPGQVEKLKALEAAVSLAPTGSEAQYANLLGELSPAPFNLNTSSSWGSTGFWYVSGVSGCRGSDPSLAGGRLGGLPVEGVNAAGNGMRNQRIDRQPAADAVPHIRSGDFVTPVNLQGVDAAGKGGRGLVGAGTGSH